MLWGAGVGLTVFLSWALARELDPDNDHSAFVGAGLVSIGVFLWGLPHFLALFCLLVLGRIVNRSSGLSARTADSMAAVVLSGLLVYQGSWGFGLAAAMAAKLAYPERQCVNITGDAGVGYMLGNFESLVRNNIGVTTIHINNGGFAGYGPGFWGPGHDYYTWEVSDHSVADMSEALKAMGYYTEDVTEPAQIIPALERAFAANGRGQPAYVEIICSMYPVFGQWVTGP